MLPSRVTDAGKVAIWKNLEARIHSVRVAKAKFLVEQQGPISKEKMKFAKGAEQNFSTELFRIGKVIERRPRTRVSVTKRTIYKINKILVKRIKRNILEYLVRCRIYLT